MRGAVTQAENHEENKPNLKNQERAGGRTEAKSNEVMTR